MEQASLSKLTPEEIEIKLDEKESEKLHNRMRHEHFNKMGSIFATHHATAISILSPANTPRRSLESAAPMSETEHAKNLRRKSDFEGAFTRLLEKKKASTIIDAPDPMPLLPPVINKDNKALFKTMLDTHVAKKKANEVALEKTEPSDSKKPAEDAAGSDEKRHKSSRMAHFSTLGKVFSTHKISSKSIVRYPKLVEFHKESLPISKDSEVLVAEEAPQTDFGGDLMVAMPSPPKVVVSSTDMAVKLAPVNISKSNAPLVKSMLAVSLTKLYLDNYCLIILLSDICIHNHINCLIIIMYNY